MAKKSKLGRVRGVSAETASSLAQTPLNRAYHVFVDLEKARGEYVPPHEQVEAERCRRRNPDYNPLDSPGDF